MCLSWVFYCKWHWNYKLSQRVICSVFLWPGMCNILSFMTQKVNICGKHKWLVNFSSLLVLVDHSFVTWKLHRQCKGNRNYSMGDYNILLQLWYFRFCLEETSSQNINNSDKKIQLSSNLIISHNLSLAGIMSFSFGMVIVDISRSVGEIWLLEM